MRLIAAVLATLLLGTACLTGCATPTSQTPQTVEQWMALEQPKP